MTHKSYFPVMRHGRMVRAMANKIHCVLSFEQSENALRRIAKRSDEFLAAIKRAFEEAAAEQGASFEWLEQDNDLVPELAPARRNRGLGAIFDFKEVAFRLNGAAVMSRGCVTLCVQTGASEAHLTEPPYSKFWLRYNLISHPKSEAPGQRAVDLDPKVLTDFDLLCAKLTERAMAAIAPLYASVIAQVLDNKVDLDTHDTGAISVLAVSSANADFPDAYNSIRAGASITARAEEKGGAAAELMALVVPAFSGIKDQTNPVTALLADDDYHSITYESIDVDRGLFFAHFTDREARFVGIARAPRDRQVELVNGDEPLRDVHNSSANIVTAGVAAQYARRL